LVNKLVFSYAGLEEREEIFHGELHSLAKLSQKYRRAGWFIELLANPCHFFSRCSSTPAGNPLHILNGDEQGKRLPSQ